MHVALAPHTHTHTHPPQKLLTSAARLRLDLHLQSAYLAHPLIWTVILTEQQTTGVPHLQLASCHYDVQAAAKMLGTHNIFLHLGTLFPMTTRMTL